MNADSAHKSGWAIAEVVFGVPFLSSSVLQFLVPISFPQIIPSQALLFIGIVLIIIGIAVIVAARRELARYRQPTDPGQPTSQVVKTGIFAISRNPLYLGSVVFLGGVALLLNSLWALAALLLSLMLCHYVLIAPEEKYLQAKFGAEYAEYIAAVRRWVGRS